MINSNFDKNGVDKSGTHWLQYTAFVINALAIYFGWAFLIMLISTISPKKYSSSGIVMDI